MELKGINTFHHSENVDTKNISQKIITEFYDYIMAA